MKRNINPKVIAAGLFNVAEQNDDLDVVRDALGLLNRLVMESGQFRVLIQSKKINGKSKVEILNSVLGQLSHPLVNEIVFFLKGSSAASELREVSNLYESMYKQKIKTIEVQGVVASAMSDQQIENLEDSLGDILGKKTKLSIEVDPSIVGGIKLRIDNTFLDASIHNQLQTLRSELLQT